MLDFAHVFSFAKIIANKQAQTSVSDVLTLRAGEQAMRLTFAVTLGSFAAFAVLDSEVLCGFLI